MPVEGSETFVDCRSIAPARGTLFLVPLLAGLTIVTWSTFRESEGSAAADAEPIDMEPVDITAAGHVDVDPMQNAFEMYEQAAALVVSMPIELVEPFHAVIEQGWQVAGKELREWLEKNREALELFRRGSERADALYRQPAELTLKNSFGIIAKLRQLVDLARLEGMRLEHAGDFRGAWLWYRALLRASRHWGRHGTTIERLIGQMAHAFATNAIVRWASFPEVHASMIRAALDDVRAIYAQAVPCSRPLAVEYLILRETMSDVKAAESIAGHIITVEKRREGVVSLLKRHHEPERSVRVLKLAYANWLSQCDRPRASRTATAPGALELYELAPGSPSDVSPAEIQRWHDRTVIAKFVLSSRPVVIGAIDREQARQRMLEIALALHLHYRQTGEFPDTLQPLVGKEFTQVPSDPFGRGQPLHYRREPLDSDGATLWSVGPDEIDDNARIEFGKQMDERGDFLMHLKPPRPTN